MQDRKQEEGLIKNLVQYMSLIGENENPKQQNGLAKAIKSVTGTLARAHPPSINNTSFQTFPVQDGSREGRKHFFIRQTTDMVPVTHKAVG